MENLFIVCAFIGEALKEHSEPEQEKMLKLNVIYALCAGHLIFNNRFTF